jgi:hypothetical protein
MDTNSNLQHVAQYSLKLLFEPTTLESTSATSAIPITSTVPPTSAIPMTSTVPLTSAIPTIPSIPSTSATRPRYSSTPWSKRPISQTPAPVQSIEGSVEPLRLTPIPTTAKLTSK